jgi:putative tryptophan/tyrosine transport system substrate-binding protein
MAMKRREFIAGVGSAAAWPLIARGQDRIRRVVVVMIGREDDAGEQQRVVLLRDGLRKLGWNEGQNIQLEFLWRGVSSEAAMRYVGEIAAKPPDVVVTTGLNGFLAMRRDASSIPLVFVNLPDPVIMGVVPSLTNPGGNFTGFTAYEFSIAGKWLQILKELAPHITRVAMTFGTAASAVGENFYRSLQAAARSSGVETTAIRINSSVDIQYGIDAFAAQPNGGLINRIPAVYPDRDFVENGGLAFYGLDFLNLYRGAAIYVDRILRGTKASDLPVQAPTKFELVINRRAANTIGLEIPTGLLVRADEVIE